MDRFNSPGPLGPGPLKPLAGLVRPLSRRSAPRSAVSGPGRRTPTTDLPRGLAGLAPVRPQNRSFRSRSGEMCPFGDIAECQRSMTFASGSCIRGDDLDGGGAGPADSKDAVVMDLQRAGRAGSGKLSNSSRDQREAVRRQR
jgi:hypothetical protein